MVNGNFITNKNYIAEIFSDFFVNVGLNLASRKENITKKECCKLIFH